MKINGIKALDYQEQGDRLTLRLTGTSMEDITAMDTNLLRVMTDDGDPVDAFAGYALSRVTYDVQGDTYTAVLVPSVPDGTGKALEAVERRVESVEPKLEQLRADADFIAVMGGVEL